MTMENSKKSAYPTENWSNIGLTKREYFAGLAMQGLMTKDFVKLSIDLNGYEFTNTKMVAEISVSMADALLNALSK